MRAAPLLLLCAACSAGAEPAARPDVLVVVADDLASKAVGAFGGTWIETPHIDALVNAGVAFTRAACSSPFCTPSRQSFLTGRWPHAIGVTQIGSLLPPESTTLASVLSDAGYRTAAFGKMHWPPEAGGATYGFDRVVGRPEWEAQLTDAERPGYEAQRALWRRSTRQGWSTLNPGRQPCPLSEERQLAPWLVDHALEYLEEDDAPALVFVSFYEPHPPFNFPPRLRDSVDPGKLALPEVDRAAVRANAPGLAAAFAVRERANGELTEEIERGAIASYLASVLWLDEAVGRLTAGLDAAGRRDRTLIVFWSDNGFFLGERGIVGKNYPFREAAEVPLAISGPGIAPRRCDALVELIDVFPTVCELTGASLPPRLDGTSLVPLLHADGAVRDQAYTELVGLAAAVWTRDAKLVLGAREGQGWDLLYDLERDPGETRNRFDDPALSAVRADLLDRMHALLAATPADGIGPERWMTQSDELTAIRWALRQVDARAR